MAPNTKVHEEISIVGGESHNNNNNENSLLSMRESDRQKGEMSMDKSRERWSSGVVFHPQGRFWRIGGEWYDFDAFDHPGGREILYLARDRFDDATYAFEAHHLDYKRARAIIRKYKLAKPLQKELNDSPPCRPLGCWETTLSTVTSEDVSSNTSETKNCPWNQTPNASPSSGSPSLYGLSVTPIFFYGTPLCPSP